MFYLSGNFNFNSKHNEFGTFVCHSAIIMEMAIDRSPSSEYPPWSLSRVTGPTLDPGKHWYVLTKSLCGLRPKEFAASEIFSHYQDEIQSVAPKDLKPAARGCDFNRQPPHLYVVSSFGLCAGLLRQRKFAPDCFVRSEKFASVVDSLNGILIWAVTRRQVLAGKVFLRIMALKKWKC